MKLKPGLIIFYPIDQGMLLILDVGNLRNEYQLFWPSMMGKFYSDYNVKFVKTITGYPTCDVFEDV